MAQTYRANYRILVLAAFILFTPLALLDALLSDVEIDVDEFGTVRGVALLAGLVLNLIVGAMGHELDVGIAGGVVMAHRGGQKHGLGYIARRLPYVRLILADLIFALGLGLGLLLLVVPGLLVLGWFALAGAVIKIEDRPLFKAFGRSRQLVRGNFWIVLLIVGGIYAIENLVETGAQAGAVWVFGHGILSEWLEALVVDLITVPIYAVSAVVLCFELIRIKGGAPSEEIARVAAATEPVEAA